MKVASAAPGTYHSPLQLPFESKLSQFCQLLLENQKTNTLDLICLTLIKQNSTGINTRYLWLCLHEKNEHVTTNSKKKIKRLFSNPTEMSKQNVSPDTNKYLYIPLNTSWFIALLWKQEKLDKEISWKMEKLILSPFWPDLSHFQARRY